MSFALREKSRSTYTITPALAQHMRQLNDIEMAAEALFPLENLPMQLRGHPTNLDDFRTSRQNHLLWVATDELNVPVAFIHCNIVDGSLHITEFDVHPDHGRQGIGTRLLQHVLQIGKQRGFAAVTLTTFEHLPWNAPFYARHGFEVLHSNVIGAELASIVRREADAGLKRRVVMGLKLQADTAWN